MHKVLVVDDSRQTLEVIQRNLTASGYDAYTCPGVQEAVRFLENSTVDLVITDYKMPGQNGLDLIRWIREHINDIEIIMITGYPDIKGAVQAVKHGADEYLVKPFTDEELLSAVRRMMDKLRSHRKAQSLSRPPRTFGIIGESPKMLHVFHRIEKAASTEATVLISGESGTGKEIVARAIHYNSDRRSKPFVPVNCTAIPDTLLESELFGHIKGAFTGASDNRDGFFQIADGGTVFLDEIGDASMNMQAKLLRVLQNKEVRQVGSGRIRHVNTRIIAATHKNLPAMVEKGLFREDLFYRLNVIDVPVPALSEREDDLLLLINHFTELFCREIGRYIPMYSDNALKAMKRYTWPGNVRELENLIQRLMVIVDHDPIRCPDLPESMRFAMPVSKTGPLRLEDVVNAHIREVMTRVKGNKTQAARLLDIDRKTLGTRLRKMGMEEEAGSPD